MKKQVAVIFGGESPEHEVSIITGLQAIEHLDKTKFEAIPVYIAKTGEWYTGRELTNITLYKNLSLIGEKSTQSTITFDAQYHGLLPLKKQLFSFGKGATVRKIDVMFPTFHGGLGENGGTSGLFELMHVPYVGPGITGGVLGMDKVIMKQVLTSANVPIAKWLWFYRNSFEENRNKKLDYIESQLQYPLFVKPANGGSSIGTTKVAERKALAQAIEVASLFDTKIVIEESVEGAREINVSVLGNAGGELQVSVCEEVFAKGALLSYEDKYLGSETKTGTKSQGMASTKRQIPANIPREVERMLQETAKTVFNTLDASGVSRIDFLYQEKTGKIFVIEINTIPGSLSFYLWESSGVPFQELLTRLIDLAYERFEEKQKNTTTFQSNILENFNANRGAKGKV